MAAARVSLLTPASPDALGLACRGMPAPLAQAMIWAVVGTALGLPALPVHAQQTGSVGIEAQARRNFDVPAGTLDQALGRLGRQAGVQIAVNADLTTGLQSPGVSGNLTIAEAMRALLAGTGLDAVRDASGEYTLRKMPVPPQVVPPGPGRVSSLAPVAVTGYADNGSTLPQPYAGGQVARGGRVGFLGDKDFMETPFSLTAYTAQTMADQQARTIADVIENNPAFRTIYPDNDVATDFIVRGNKVKALDAAYGGLYGLMSPGLEALERIEVLSGANALLNGLGPIGGVGGSINQVPKRALDTPLTRLTTRYISDSQLGVQADISRRFGEDQRLGVRFNGAYSDGDTSTDTQSKKVAMGALALDYRGDQFRIAADVGYRKNNTQSPSRTAYLTPGFSIPAPPKSGANWQQPWSYDNTQALMGALRGEYDISSDVTAHVAIGASRYREAELFANSFLYAADGSLQQRQVYWPLYRDSSTAEVGLNGRIVTGSVKHNWAASASGLWIENGIILNELARTFTNIYSPVFIPQPSITGLAGPGSVPRTASTRLGGVAVADTMSFLEDRLQLTLGLRHQSVSTDNFKVTGERVAAGYKKSVTTPGVGVIVKAARNVSLYANYIEGLQQGLIATGGSNSGTVFAPYVSKQQEAGVKIDFGRIATTLGVYQLKTPNGYMDTAANVYRVDGEQRTRGVELNTFGEVVTGVRVLGGVALVDARQTKTLGGATDGKRVTGAPKLQFNLGGEVDVTALPGLTVSARAVHTAGQYVDNANLQSIPSWTRYDAGIRYRTRWNNTPTTLRLNVQNVFDKSYWAAAIDGYVIQSTARTVLLSATFDF